MKIYCEHSAVTADLRALQRDGRIELVHFPYDSESRARAIAPRATPSDAQWRDLNTTWDELTGTWDDFKGSEHLREIRRIIGTANRREALHVDSAYKTGCEAIITVDRDILDHRSELEALLGLRIFHPDKTRRSFVASSLVAVELAKLRVEIRHHRVPSGATKWTERSNEPPQRAGGAGR